MKHFCKYCKGSSYGESHDGRHPENLHEHNSDGEHCVYCGVTYTGYCQDGKHPRNVHEF